MSAARAKEATVNLRARTRVAIPSGKPTLTDTISSLCTEFRGINQELCNALRENRELRQEVAEWRTRHRTLTGTDLPALRRRVAFCCHPDRGGDADLMGTLNALFDVLEDHGHMASLENTKGGSA